MRKAKSEIDLKAIIKANLLLNECFVDYPDELDINEIALVKNCLVKESRLEGHTGRIVTTGKYAVITVDARLDRGQKNFVKSHELGHKIFEETISNFACNEEDLRERKKYNEALPNQFAAELLMKRDWFFEFTTGKGINFRLLKEAANYFNTSLSSVCIRYSQLGDTPCAFIFTTGGKIKWKAIHHSFPYFCVNDKLSGLSYVKDYFETGTKYEEPQEVEAEAWFRNDMNYRDGAKLVEKSFYMPSYDSVLTMLKD